MWKSKLWANNGHKENRESQNDSSRLTNINSSYNTKPKVNVSARKQSAKHSNYLYSLVHLWINPWLSEFNHNGKMHFPGMKIVFTECFCILFDFSQRLKGFIYRSGTLYIYFIVSFIHNEMQTINQGRFTKKRQLSDFSDTI